MADFVRCYEPLFLHLVSKSYYARKEQNGRSMRQKLETDRKRLGELQELLPKLYEDYALKRISEDFYDKMAVMYPTEQKDLMRRIAETEKRLSETVNEKMDLRMLLTGLRKFTDVGELTPEIVNMLIKRIEVHNSERIDGHLKVKVDVYFTAVGLIDLPTENEIQALMAEMQKPQAKPEKPVASA